MKNIDFDYIQKALNDNDFIYREGQVTQIVGLKIEVKGISGFVGELCYIYNNRNKKVKAEIVGFNDETIFLMPLGELNGISIGCKVVTTKQRLEVECDENILGKD